MSLFKRGGTYTSFIYLHGVRYARALHTGNRRLAEQLDRQHKDELIEREFQHDDSNPAMTFAELCVRFLAEADVKPTMPVAPSICSPTSARWKLARSTATMPFGTGSNGMSSSGSEQAGTKAHRDDREPRS